MERLRRAMRWDGSPFLPTRTAVIGGLPSKRRNPGVRAGRRASLTPAITVVTLFQK